MEIALSTGCLYENPLAEVFEMAQIVGFDGIELLIDRTKSDISPYNICNLSKEYNTPVLSVHSPFMACDGWGGFWDRIYKSINLAKELSAKLINFHPQRGLLLYHNLDGKLSDHVNKYKNSIKNYNILLTIENLPCPIHLIEFVLLRKAFQSLADNTNQLAEFAREKNIFVTFDTTHVGTTGQDILEVYNVFKGIIANIHLSDYDGITQHLLPGKGKLPLKAFLKQLKTDGYDGIITLETRPSAMESKDTKKVIDNAKYCLSYIKECII